MAGILGEMILINDELMGKLTLIYNLQRQRNSRTQMPARKTR